MSTAVSSPHPDAQHPPVDASGGLQLVFGASGYVGTNLVPYLAATGLPVRACARRLSAMQDRQWQGVECIAADALQPDSLPTVLDGVETAYYLVHSMAAGANFGQLDLQAAANFRDAAAAAGVKRIVYLGGLVSDTPDSEHLQSRLETGELLRQGTVSVTELRAGMIIGPGSAAFEVMRDLVNHLPVMITPRWVHSQSPPIALSDLLYDLVALAQTAEAAGNIYDASGPEVLSYADLMRKLGVALNKRFTLVPVPVLTPRLSALWLRLVSSVPYNIARALVDGLRENVTADDTNLRALVPRAPLSVSAAIDAALHADLQQDATPHWTEGSIRCRNYQPHYAYYAKQAGAELNTAVDPAFLWPEICRFGKRQDYFALNALWWLRGAADWLLGGPAFRRPRRDPDQLRINDVIDAWRVIGLETEKKLTLLLEMRIPGAGVLEFTLTPIGDRQHLLRITAYFHPAGVWGLLYWYPLVPFHQLIFRGMVSAIERRAAASGSADNSEGIAS